VTISNKKCHAETQSDIRLDDRKIVTPCGNPDVTNITNIEMFVIFTNVRDVCEIRVMFVTSGYFSTPNPDMTQYIRVI